VIVSYDTLRRWRHMLPADSKSELARELDRLMTEEARREADAIAAPCSDDHALTR
jgi:hypothetical protein